jgi:DNA-binding CsgD family transcriptional regulator
MTALKTEALALRDAKTLALVAEGPRRPIEVAAALGISPHLAYWSLRRLHASNQVHRNTDRKTYYLPDPGAPESGRETLGEKFEALASGLNRHMLQCFAAPGGATPGRVWRMIGRNRLHQPGKP